MKVNDNNIITRRSDPMNPQYKKLWYKKQNPLEHTIVCQLCGKRLKSMNTHLSRKHNTDIKNYREMFPLAPTICKETSKLKSEVQKRVISDLSQKEKNKLIKRLEPSWKKGKNRSEVQIRRVAFAQTKYEWLKTYCDYCKNEIFIREDNFKKYKKHFCSWECIKSYWKIHSVKVRVICDNCGKRFLKYPNYIGEHIFCSKKCFLNFVQKIGGWKKWFFQNK